MKIYNTLTRKKEEFIPVVEGQVSMYICGPTVYNYIHVGNARPMVIFDTLRRFFMYRGYNVKYISNFTDIDDRIINRANEENTAFNDISERYIKALMEDAKGLNIYEEKTIHPKATEFIQPMIEFIEALIEKGAAYNVDGNVYFNIDSAKDYGKLSKKNIEDLMSGARIEVSEEKNNPMDFALWKKAKEGEPYWESPWGNGRPGWHIECSVMSRTLLGDTIDIHAGGEDLQFPHHENEIAQSETLTEKPFANYWMHNGMLNVENQKMSKSLGNFFTVKEIAEEFDLEILRFFLLSAHYRSPMNFTREIMNQMENALERLYNGKKNLEYLLENTEDRELDKEEKDLLDTIEKFKKEFIESMEDDLNTADAIASLFDLVKFSNSNLNEKSSKKLIQISYDLLLELSDVLGILNKKDEILEVEILDLIEKRTMARKNKDFKLADEIRDMLKEKGIVLEDTQEGVKWKRI
ncbi:cysteine--tRNA ligase [Tissierella carlieri]|uniref:cysteine--tRNA ligase n=1 Tax=Tissierella carlieri TaxID=689904 RepID=UPI001C1294AA|nr:cysteine--tRNA ligase [Tissierella carlieri]MBU5311764.1 cysteine--tRNA ligase [Tissierella carlieri]MDU5080739.1 cysteine--tRNA ligase [Bacillota bacterium]